MNITQSQNIITITGTVTADYDYIHVIQQATIADTTSILESITNSISTKSLLADGYYQITEIKLPTTPGEYYYTNGTIVYDPNGDAISIANLLLVNPIGTNIVREDTDFITVYLLNTYYINLLKTKFLNGISGCECINKSEKLTIDFLTMGLYLIESLVIAEQYNECQRIIEQLGICSGVVTPNCNCNG